MASWFKSYRVWGVVVTAAISSVLVWHLVTRPRFGRRTMAVLGGATRVEVFRIDGKNGPKSRGEDGKRLPKVKGERRVGGFLVTAQGRDRGPAFAADLAEILGDPNTYTDTYANCYWPGVAFRAWRDDRCVEVLVCFYCDNLHCGPPTEWGKENASFYGSPRRADLVRLAKEAFPDDAEVQALED